MSEEMLNYDVSKYRTPDGYTSDIAVFTIISTEVGAYKPPQKTLKIMLIKRAEKTKEGDPNIEAGKWALPGGFIRPEETAYDAAVRELSEETGVTGLRIKHFGVYDQIGRDRRGWIISNAHYAIVPENKLIKRRAADDAAEVELFSMDEVFQLELAFDHRQIIEEALWFIKKDMSLTTVAKNFLPKQFVLSELQGVLLTVMDEPWLKLDAQFFRKAPTLPFIEKVMKDGEPQKTNRWSKNKAQLYQFNDYEPYVSIYNAKY
ncbi:NUDIX hydrolase [Bacillus sp. DTU_2020_1000418_1_SI_GHA_SEK_038]|uniref:NUDIX hydrolase n=1 Tax=Bacillus sp. DTU_2020_1000418_1_SI_GHA_SEK_038 TaxID=3077585 RepID=UPI0028E6CB4B|nr:NUDIX hydrolase [Bacillus sp. DTU_2020_1000418_1_SI_GHA_SEK_038]WNS73697.1 NUDIX hydrolase [Bacillus sp. DTU_2020_1000418_1_SI_GHA_SEK_038]